VTQGVGRSAHMARRMVAHCKRAEIRGGGRAIAGNSGNSRSFPTRRPPRIRTSPRGQSGTGGGFRTFARGGVRLRGIYVYRRRRLAGAAAGRPATGVPEARAWSARRGSGRGPRAAKVETLAIWNHSARRPEKVGRQQLTERVGGAPDPKAEFHTRNGNVPGTKNAACRSERRNPWS